MKNEIMLIENKKLREEMIDRVDVLEKVKELLLLEELEMATTEMVADYYNVTKELISNYIIPAHKDELLSDGYCVETKDNLLTKNILVKTKRGGFNILGKNDNIIASGSNRGIALFTPRSILRVGMLLRDSEVAKEIRTQLLNIHDNVMVETPNIAIKDIDEEFELMNEITKATLSGDVMALNMAHCKYNEWKNRHIKHKIEAYDSFMEADGTYTTTNACKLLNLSPRKTFAWLRDKGLVFQNRTEATVKAIEMGIFKQIMKNNYSTMVITPAGIEYLRENCKHLIKPSNINKK